MIDSTWKKRQVSFHGKLTFQFLPFDSKLIKTELFITVKLQSQKFTFILDNCFFFLILPCDNLFVTKRATMGGFVMYQFLKMIQRWVKCFDQFF